MKEIEAKTEKAREVIPDLLTIVTQAESVLEGLQDSIDQLNTSLHSSPPTQGAEAESEQPRALGDIEVLEKKTNRLLNNLKEADKDLRSALISLLGS